MKRFLYILLFLSLSYNVIVLSRWGYEFYQTQKRQSEWKRIEKVSFEEGLEDFRLKMKQQCPQHATKELTYITFVNNSIPYIDYHEMNAEDSLINSMINKSQLLDLKILDSLAAIYNNINFVCAYQGSDERIDKLIFENKTFTKSIIYIKDVPKLLIGYGNIKKRKGFSFPTTFLVSKSGEILYETSISISFDDKKLIKILNGTK